MPRDTMIIDPNGRPALSAKHEIELNKLAAATLDWLAQEVIAAMRRSRNGQLEIDARAVRERLDQLYMLGRHHQAGA